MVRVEMGSPGRSRPRPLRNGPPRSGLPPARGNSAGLRGSRRIASLQSAIASSWRSSSSESGAGLAGATASPRGTAGSVPAFAATLAGEAGVDSGPAAVRKGERTGTVAELPGRCSPGEHVPGHGHVAAGGRRSDARLVRDGPEFRVGPDTAEADRHAEEQQHEPVGFLPALDPPLALVEQVAAEFVELPLQVDDSGAARVGAATVRGGRRARLAGFRPGTRAGREHGHGDSRPERGAEPSARVPGLATSPALSGLGAKRPGRPRAPLSLRSILRPLHARVRSPFVLSTGSPTNRPARIRATEPALGLTGRAPRRTPRASFRPGRARCRRPPSTGRSPRAGRRRCCPRTSPRSTRRPAWPGPRGRRS